MIIPTMSGVFFGESFSALKLLAVFVLIGFIYLSLGKSNGGRINKRWILFCALAFVFQGSIGVLQKVHQSSSHKAELNGFLFVAFTCSLIYQKAGYSCRSLRSLLVWCKRSQPKTFGNFTEPALFPACKRQCNYFKLTRLGFDFP